MVLRSRAVCGAFLMGLSIWFWYRCWGEWGLIGQPMTPGYPKVWTASEVWSMFTSLLFLTTVSGCVLWTALRGNPTRLSAELRCMQSSAYQRCGSYV